VVLNLAAGLDTRPYRLALPATLRWIEVDFADILAYKAEQLAGEKPVCVLERVAATAQSALVISEGLLIYLSPAAVSGLAAALHARQAYGFWLFDLASPALLQLMERTWGRAVAAGNAPFQFAPETGTRFFEPHGWREREFHSMWEESLRLGRTMRFARLWRLVGWLAPRARREMWRRMSGIVLMERASEPAV